MIPPRAHEGATAKQGDQHRKDDELDARLGLRTFNEIRKSRGLEPFADPRFDKPILPKAGEYKWV